MDNSPDSETPGRRVDGHQTACALLARRWVDEGLIPRYAEGYASALLASRSDIALRDVIHLCRGHEVPGYLFPHELRLDPGSRPAGN